MSPSGSLVGDVGASVLEEKQPSLRPAASPGLTFAPSRHVCLALERMSEVSEHFGAPISCFGEGAEVSQGP